MAITHHAILEYCMSQCESKCEYYVLGDDVVIQGDELFEMYQLVTQTLGMELNDDKTFKSTHIFEFAKRFFYEQEEVSPFPLGAILNSRGDLSLFLPGLLNAHAKSWLLDTDSDTRVRLFSSMLQVFSKKRGCSVHASKLLNYTYELQLYGYWINDTTATERPFGLTQLEFSCSKSDK